MAASRSESGDFGGGGDQRSGGGGPRSWELGRLWLVAGIKPSVVEVVTPAPGGEERKATDDFARTEVACRRTDLEQREKSRPLGRRRG